MPQPRPALGTALPRRSGAAALRLLKTESGLPAGRQGREAPGHESRSAAEGSAGLKPHGENVMAGSAVLVERLEKSVVFALSDVSPSSSSHFSEAPQSLTLIVRGKLGWRLNCRLGWIFPLARKRAVRAALVCEGEVSRFEVFNLRVRQARPMAGGGTPTGLWPRQGRSQTLSPSTPPSAGGASSPGRPWLTRGCPHRHGRDPEDLCP